MLPRCTDDTLSNFSRLSHRCFCLSSTLADGCWTDGAEGLFGRALRNRREGSVLRLRQGAGALLRCLRGGVVTLALLAGGGLVVPGGVGSQRWRVVEAVLVINPVGRVELRVLQSRDQALVFITKLPSHQRGLSHHHHILKTDEKTFQHQNEPDSVTLLFSLEHVFRQM